MRILMFYCLLILLPSCATTAQLKETENVNICSFLDNGKEIRWEQVKDPSKLKLKETVRQTKLPTKYTVYQTNEQDLKTYFQTVNKSTEQSMIIIPLNNQCIAFKISSSGTMSKELAAKFPDIISLKGVSISSELVSLRIDYKDGNLKMEINDRGQIFLIETWPGESGNYFLLYNKDDAGYPKSSIQSE